MNAIESIGVHPRGLGSIWNEGAARAVTGRVEDRPDDREGEDRPVGEPDGHGDDRHRSHRECAHDISSDRDRLPAEAINEPSGERCREQGGECTDRCHRTRGGGRARLLEHEPWEGEHDDSVAEPGGEVRCLEEQDGEQPARRRHNSPTI